MPARLVLIRFSTVFQGIEWELECSPCYIVQRRAYKLEMIQRREEILIEFPMVINDGLA